MHKMLSIVLFSYCLLIRRDVTAADVNTTKENNDDFELTILHTNDVHARIEEFNKYIGECQNSTKCYGGMARLSTAINEIRSRDKNVIVLDGGDQFQGTLWYNTYKWRVPLLFMNYIQYDAMTFGNHEFDDGPAGLIPFINNTNFPVLAGNMDASAEKLWPKDEKYNRKSVVIEKNGRKIGLIGYISQDTSWLSNPGPNIKFYDEVDYVREEAKRLKSQGIDILIALGHAGIKVDMKIAKGVPDIDVVVGGHSNTFLHNGKQPSVERSNGPYPLLYVHSNGRQTLVVQDYAYAKYLGNLKVRFDANGTVTDWSGNPILLDSSFKKDPVVSDKIKKMLNPITRFRKQAIGRSLVHLKVCRRNEMTMGNLITDAVVKVTQRMSSDKDHWASVTLAMFNAGGMRTHIIKKISETISLEDLTSVLPFGNMVNLMEVNGKTLKQAFEWSAARRGTGGFLQVSGFKVMYAMKNPYGERLVELLALCSKCRVPKYEPVEDDKIYKVLTSNYILNGGDGYSMLRNVKNHAGDTVLRMVKSYIKKNSPISVVVEGRIRFLEDEKKKYCKNTKKVAAKKMKTKQRKLFNRKLQRLFSKMKKYF